MYSDKLLADDNFLGDFHYKHSRLFCSFNSYFKSSFFFFNCRFDIVRLFINWLDILCEFNRQFFHSSAKRLIYILIFFLIPRIYYLTALNDYFIVAIWLFISLYCLEYWLISLSLLFYFRLISFLRDRLYYYESFLRRVFYNSMFLFYIVITFCMSILSILFNSAFSLFN